MIVEGAARVVTRAIGSLDARAASRASLERICAGAIRPGDTALRLDDRGVVTAVCSPPPARSRHAGLLPAGVPLFETLQGASADGIAGVSEVERYGRGRLRIPIEGPELLEG